MSFAILVSETATALSAPDASTSPSRAACASNGSAGGEIARPGVGREPLAHPRGELGVGVQPGADRGAAERDLAEPRAASPRPARAPRAPAPRSRRTPGPASPARRPSGACARSSRCRRTRPPCARAPRRGASSAGRSSFVAASSAARWTADGKTSFDDWPMLTWSFGWTPSPASVAITSLAFMLDEVPEPVWKTSIGNWSSCWPSRDLVGRRGDARRRAAASSRPEVGVHARGRGLDAAQPVHDRRRDRLAGDGEVLDRLSGLGAPKLGLPGHVGHCVGDYSPRRARRDIRQAWR